MKRRLAAGALSAALCLSAGWSLAGWATAEGGPTTIGIRNGVSEFSFSLTRTKVKPGPALIQYQNTGEDPHDVRLRRRGSDTVIELPETLPGEVNNFPNLRLKRDSKYIVWCSLDGHREAGMETGLKVKKRR
jgi:plastocyanin